MSDVSITDLIAVARNWSPQLGSVGTRRLFELLADALESVTAPTENEREMLNQSLKVAMLGTTDGGFIDMESDIPAGEMFRLAAEWVAANTNLQPVQVEVSEVHKQLMRSNIRNAVQREMGCERRAHYGNVEHPFCGEHGHLGQWPCPVSEAVTSAALVAALGGQVEVNDSRIAKALSIIDRDVEALANLDPTELRAALGGEHRG